MSRLGFLSHAPSYQQVSGDSVELLKDIASLKSVNLGEASTDDDDQNKRASACDSDSMCLITSFLSVSGTDPSASVTRLLQKLVRMLRTCKYADEDIIGVLAVAACHHQSFISTLEKPVSVSERGFILVAQIYIAHCIVLDEYCAISNWHRYLFSTYCDLRGLNSAVSRILKRMDWRLTVDQARIDSYIHVLTCAHNHQ